MESHLQEGINQRECHTPIDRSPGNHFCKTDFQSIKNDLEKREKHYVDEEIKISDLIYDINLPSEFPFSQILHSSGFISSLNFNRFSYGQLLSQMQLPIGYLKSCPRWLQEKNINYHFQKTLRKSVVLRKYKYSSPYAELPLIRGVVSTKYPIKKMDNLPLLTKINEVFTNLLLSQGVTDPKLEWVINGSPFSETSIIDITFEQDESYILGVRIINSELGYKSFQVHPLVSSPGNIRKMVIINEGPFSTWMNHTSGNANELLNPIKDLKDHLLYKILSNAIEGARAIAGHVLLEGEKTVIPVKEIDKLSSLSMPLIILDSLKEEFDYKDKENQIHQRAKKAEILQSIFKIIEKIGYFKNDELNPIRDSVTKLDEYIRVSQAISGYLNFKELTVNSLQSTFNSLLDE